MGQPYIGEIRMFGGNFPPVGWMFCNGQSLPISENDALFRLIGTTYGGDGQETFRLPDLRGRLPIHQGTGPGLSNRTLAEQAGVESVTLTVQQIPAHSHPLLASNNVATSNQVNDNIPASLLAAGTQSAYANKSPFGTLNPDTISPVGGSQPHDNFQPYLCINFIISLFGEFPTAT